MLLVGVASTILLLFLYSLPLGIFLDGEVVLCYGIS